jgi:hypothetical protein
MNGAWRGGGCRFHAELIPPSNFKTQQLKDTQRVSRTFRMAWVLLCAFAGMTLASPDTSMVRAVPTCLSISPFRALPALGKGFASPEDLRDQVIAAFRGQLDSGWIARPAGFCPEPMAVLDIFQMPSDVVVSADGPTLRIRLEWHHQPGQTEFFLPCPKRAPPPAKDFAEQLRAVAQQMAARVELHSVPEGAALRVTGLSVAQESLRTPMILKAPPGAFSAEFSLNGLTRRMDTVVVTGGLYEIRADFRAAHINPGMVPTSHRTWPWWGTTAIAAAGAIFFEWRQSNAQIAYSSLGAGDSPDRYTAKWNDLRQANLLRNGFLGFTLILGTGSAWFEWAQNR